MRTDEMRPEKWNFSRPPCSVPINTINPFVVWWLMQVDADHATIHLSVEHTAVSRDCKTEIQHKGIGKQAAFVLLFRSLFSDPSRCLPVSRSTNPDTLQCVWLMPRFAILSSGGDERQVIRLLRNEFAIRGRTMFRLFAATMLADDVDHYAPI